MVHLIVLFVKFLVAGVKLNIMYEKWSGVFSWLKFFG